MTDHKANSKGFKLAFCFILLLLPACSISVFAAPSPNPTFFVAPLQTSRPVIPTTTQVPATKTLTPTDRPLPTPNPSLVMVPAGDLKIPILLYHHVSDVTPTNRYFVAPKFFRRQMEKLRDLGYTTISISNMVNVLMNGGRLPAHPIVITFDDGNADIYDNAFPIMKEMNFSGVLYIVANRLESSGFLNTDQLKEMAAAGWEIGSHSVTHTDLTTNYKIVLYEELQSRLDLEGAVGVPVKTFSYPFGLTNKYVKQSVQDTGYQAAVGLGTSNEHSYKTLYYLSRREVQGDYNLDQFMSLLVLSGSPEDTLTPAPN